MDVELTVGLLEQAQRIGHAGIFSEDADLRRAFEAAQRQSMRVTAISSLHGTAAQIGHDLRRQVERFVELGDIAEHFTRQQIKSHVRTPSPVRHPADRRSDEAS